MNVEQEIERRLAENMRAHNLKQAHKALADARADLRRARDLAREAGAEDDAIAIGNIIVNPLEGSMWKIEQTIRKEAK